LEGGGGQKKKKREKKRGFLGPAIPHRLWKNKFKGEKEKERQPSKIGSKKERQKGGKTPRT